MKVTMKVITMKFWRDNDNTSVILEVKSKGDVLKK